MRIARLVGAALALAALGGCHSVYVAPSGSATAEVRLVNDTTLNVGAHYYAGTEKCTQDQVIGGIDPGATKTIRLAAGKPATFALQPLGLDGIVIKSCIFAVSFRPRIGTTYAIKFDADGKRCYLSNRQIVNGKSLPATFVRRTYRTPFFESGGFCASLTSAERTLLMRQ